ncbi:MAG: hypothetical protein ACRETA_08945 [Gammaproteobacteria bacterium]
MESETKNDLRCTFKDAEHNHLLDGIRMTTNEKIRSFEDMLDFAWSSGMIKQLRVSVPVDGNA